MQIHKLGIKVFILGGKKAMVINNNFFSSWFKLSTNNAPIQHIVRGQQGQQNSTGSPFQDNNSTGTCSNERPENTFPFLMQWQGSLSVTGGGGGGGGANTQTAAPPPPPPTHTHTQTHMLPFCQNFLSRYRGGCRILARRGWVGRTQKKFVVRVLIFPQIVLETKAINTNK